MNTITLPDHISFEEIAAKWCSDSSEWSSNAMIYYEGILWKIVYFYTKENSKFCDPIVVFTLDMKTRRLWEIIGHEEPLLALSILDYIKERSHV